MVEYSGEEHKHSKDKAFVINHDLKFLEYMNKKK